MNKILIKNGCTIILIVFFTISKAQVLIGGELTYNIEGEIVTFYVTTYSINEPQDYVNLDYGDGGINVVYLTAEMINDTVYKNTGSDQHIFLADGLYLVTCDGGYLMDDIRNIEESGSKQLYMKVIFRNSIDASNTAPLHSNSIMDFTVDGVCGMQHSEAAVDAEGDSIVYSHNLFSVYPDGDIYSEFPEFTDSIGINAATGEFSWVNGIYFDRYGLEFETSEYRDGLLYGTSIRKIIIDTKCGVVNTADLQQNTYSLYPYPANDFLTITSQNQDKTTYTIVDIFGNTVISESGYDVTQITLTHLPPGIYLLSAEQNGNNWEEKFVKM